MTARLGLLGGGLVLGGAVLIGAGMALGGGLDHAAMMARGHAVGPAGMMGEPSDQGRGPMMGGYGAAGTADPGPGDAGFVAGTVAAPRVVRVVAGPGYTFSPAAIVVARGETITFEVTAMGGLVHEFMVGPADAVDANAPGTPEAADIGMMQTKSVTYTFDGSGPYAFACHGTGHFEAGMRGTITVVD